MGKTETLIILSPGFPESESDSTCLPHIQQFCRLLAEEYPHVQIVVIAFQYPFRKRSSTWHSIKVHAIGGRNRKKLRRLFTWVRVYRKLNTLKKENHVIGILSLWLGETALIGKLFASRHKLRHYIWLQGQDARASNRYVRRVDPASESLLCISEFNRVELQTHHGRKAHSIVPNGVNENAFPALNTGARAIDLLGVGSLIPLKNYASFIRILHELKKNRPGIQAVLAGDGPEARELSDLAFRLGLQHNLKLVGSVPHQKIFDLMNNSKIFLHTSTYEGMSTVCLEALYSGCKVFSSISAGEEEEAYIKIFKNEEEAVVQISAVLDSPFVANRIKPHDMRNSVRKIMELYLG